MSQDEEKKAAAEAAIAYIPDGCIVGVGTGSTVNFFIDALAEIRHRIRGAVASSVATEKHLRRHEVEVMDLNAVNELPIYVDGADEVTEHRHMIKGGGGALTREKIVAAVSKQFICIADKGKRVDVLGRFPLPVEVIPMARSHVARELVKLGGQPVLREGFTTDNGNNILDVHGLRINDPAHMEAEINQIVGVVTNGLFARRGANIVILGGEDGVITHE